MSILLRHKLEGCPGVPLIERMSKSRFVVLLVALILAPILSSLVSAQEDHEHGTASIKLVRDGQSISISFLSPAANLLGFERMPESAQEWVHFASVIEDIEKVTWLLGNDLAHCETQTDIVELPSFSTTDHGHAGHDHGDDQAAGEAHGDFNVQYHMVCSGSYPEQIRITAFQRFPGIERILAQWSIEGAEGQGKLMQDAVTLSLE